LNFYLNQKNYTFDFTRIFGGYFNNLRQFKPTVKLIASSDLVTGQLTF